MKIFSAAFYPVQNRQLPTRYRYQNLSPLAYDSVSFSGNSNKPQESACTPQNEYYLHLYKLFAKMSPIFFENLSSENAGLYLDYFFKHYDSEVRSLSELCDKELNSILLDKGSRYFSDYIITINSFKKNNVFDLLKNALTCSNPDGTKLKQNQKVQLIDLLKVYKILHLSPTELMEMTEKGIVDIQKLQNSVLKSVLMYSADYSEDEFDEIPSDKFNAWNMQYAYLLPSSVKKNKTGFEDIVRLACSENDFKLEIHSDDNVYAKFNNQTKTDFENHGLNYDKWLSPSGKNNVRLIMNENDIGGLEEVAENIEDAVDLLRAVTPIRKIIDKRYKPFIHKNKFEFPNDMVNNKAELLKFLVGFDNDMVQVWKRAEKNLESSDEDIKSRAKVTMKMKEYISEYLKILHSYNPSQNIDITVKMWDRVPQKDLFQGNYSSCCIAIGKACAQYMPSYLLNTAFNMVEIVDNKSGDTIGNSLCYYLLNDKNKPVLVFDNLEINNTFKNNLSNNMLKQIREGLTAYGKNLNTEVSNDEVPIYIGTTNNDIPVEDLKSVKLKDVNLLGDMDTFDEVYVDVFGGDSAKADMSGDIELKLLKNK